MAAVQLLTSQAVGFIPLGVAAGTATLALNTAASGGFSQTWLAFSFVLSDAKTINKVRVFISAVTGTLGTTDCVCDIYSDSSGSPNSSLGSVNLGSAPSGAGWVEFTGLSIALSANTQYWIVLRNANATPTSNSPTYKWGGANSAPIAAGASAFFGWYKKHSTNGGSTWVTNLNGILGPRVGFSDGTYAGYPVSNLAVSADSTASGNLTGVKFTVPANTELNVRGIAMTIESSGTPTGNLKYGLYSGSSSSALALTQGIAPSNVGTSVNWYVGWFTSVQTLTSGVYRVAAQDTVSEATPKYICYEYTVDNDANSLPLAPWEGTAIKTLFSGVSWTDTNSAIFPFALLLDSVGGEFAQPGGFIF